MQQIRCNIEQVEKISLDVYRVTLTLPEAVEFNAGQYLEILLPDGRKTPFSVGSAPEADKQLELHIRYMPEGEVSKAILHHVQNSTHVDVELPKGNCCIQAEQVKPEDTLIFAGASTGFSQIKSMVEHLLAHQVKNPIHIYWGARIAADLYWTELPKSWEAEYENVTFHPVVSEPGDSCGWTGRVDLLPDAITADFDHFEQAKVYASGSPAMVYALLDCLEAKGLTEADMLSDVFAYAPRPKK